MGGAGYASSPSIEHVPVAEETPAGAGMTPRGFGPFFNVLTMAAWMYSFDRFYAGVFGVCKKGGAHPPAWLKKPRKTQKRRFRQGALSSCRPPLQLAMPLNTAKNGANPK